MFRSLSSHQRKHPKRRLHKLIRTVFEVTIRLDIRKYTTTILAGLFPMEGKCPENEVHWSEVCRRFFRKKTYRFSFDISLPIPNYVMLLRKIVSWKFSVLRYVS